MNRLYLFLGILSLACEIQARDLHLTDGRILKNVRLTENRGNELRFLHDGGSAGIRLNVLTEADAREFSVVVPEPAVASSSSQVRNYAGRSLAVRDYSSRSYEERSYANRTYTPPAAPKTEEVPLVSVSSRTPYTQPRSTYTTPRSYTPSKSSGGVVHVSGYTRKDGTYVRAHTRRR